MNVDSAMTGVGSWWKIRSAQFSRIAMGQELELSGSYRANQRFVSTTGMTWDPFLAVRVYCGWDSLVLCCLCSAQLTEVCTSNLQLSRDLPLKHKKKAFSMKLHFPAHLLHQKQSSSSKPGRYWYRHGICRAGWFFLDFRTKK